MSVSSTTVLATVPVVATASKLPPVGVPLIVTDRLSAAPTYASSARTVYTTLPVLAFTGIVIV